MCSLIYQDLSEWMEEDYYVMPETYDVDVLLPGRSTTLTIPVSAVSPTVITPETFKLSSKCIPDGVYCFSIDNCGTLYQRNVAVTASLECCLNSFIVDSEDFEFISRMQFHIKAIHLQASLGNVRRAQELYEIVKKELKKVNCECTCKC